VNYFKNSIEEIRKVTWPTKNQAIKLTVITIIFTIFATILIGLSDFAFREGYEAILDASPAADQQPLQPTDVNAPGHTGTMAPEASMEGLTVTDEEGDEITSGFEVETTPSE